MQVSESESEAAAGGWSCGCWGGAQVQGQQVQVQGQQVQVQGKQVQGQVQAWGWGVSWVE